MKLKIILTILFGAVVLATQAQRYCVVADMESRLPIREAIIMTDTHHYARTDYRGYWSMKYAFDSATVSKTGYIATQIYEKSLPDTVFLLPEGRQLSEVTVWGENQKTVKAMAEGIQKKINETPTSPTGIGVDLMGWTDFKGNRDKRHKKKAKKVLREWENTVVLPKKTEAQK